MYDIFDRAGKTGIFIKIQIYVCIIKGVYNDVINNLVNSFNYLIVLAIQCILIYTPLSVVFMRFTQ